MKSLQLLRTLISTFVVVLCFAALGSAQETTGTINGTVTDPNGAVVSGATVTITDAEKKVVIRTATTNEEGFFSIPNLPSGLYDVAIEISGFKKFLSPAVKVDVGQRRTLDAALETGNVSETVNVTASPTTVELTTPTASAVVSGDQAKELSLNNRNWVQLVTLAPGVSNDLADQVYVGTTNPDGQANTINISVNGARSSQNTFTVDGADITDRGSNITIQAYPSVDSISEFKVLRSLFPAESGRSGGGQVNIVTRSGSSEFHGSAFEFIRNEAFNANNFLINATATPPFGRDSNGKAKRPPFRYNNYGFTIGGPVYLPRFGEGGPSLLRGHRTFFFLSNENRKDRRFSSASSVTVPDANLRLGIFPIPVCIARLYLSETCTGANILPAGTPIPASNRSAAAASYVTNIYNRLPLPNAGTAANPYLLTTALPNIADFHQWVLKLDHSFSDRWSIGYRYQNDKIPTVDAQGLFSNGAALPGVSTTETNSPGKTHTFQSIYSLGTKTVIEGRFTYGYGAILSNNVGLISLANFVAPVALPFPNQRDRNPSIGNNASTANMTANGFTWLSSFGPYNNFSWKKNYSGTLTRIFGNHTTKYGATFSQYRKNENALAGNNEGLASVFSATLPTGVTASTLNSNIQRFANFLVGNVQTFSQAHFDYTGDLRQKTFEAFAQDEWRMRRNLTLYYGVRYSYFGAPYDANGRLSNFDPSFFNSAQAPQVRGDGTRVLATGNFCNGIIVNSQNFTTGPAAFNCTPQVSPFGKYVVEVDKKNFAPRFGFAWDPFKKGTTSVRMGYGIYHEQVLNGTYLQNIGTNPPYQETLTVSNTNLDNPAGTFTSSTTLQSLRSVQTDFHTPYMQHWQLDVQHQLGQKTVFTVGYFGSKGTHLIGLTELNDLPQGLALNSFCAPGTGYYAQTPAPTLVRCQPAGYAFRNSATTIPQGNPNVVGTTTFTDTRILDQLRPYRGYLSVVQVQPRYNSSYHSLQVSAQRRFSGASQVNLAYTWAKNLTDSPNDRSTAPQDTYNIAAEKQRATLDRRHVLVVNYIYELPFYKSQHGLVGKTLGGWQASGIATYNSGLPFSPATSNYDPAGLNFLVANPTGRPNLLCDPNANAPHTREQYFNTACFQQNPALTDALGNRILVSNTPGNAGRGIINGPPTKRVDFTMTKNVRFGSDGRYGFQLRAEVFNIFNHTNFRSFGSTNVTSSLFGIVTAVRDPRTMQFGAKVWF